MRKSLTILMALVLALFTVPVGGLTVFAEEYVYDNIEYGEHELDIQLLKEGTDEESAAAGFMNKNATLTVEEDVMKLTFYIPDNPAMEFNKFEVEGVVPEIQEGQGTDPETGTSLDYYTFILAELTTKLSSIVSYEVPMLGLIHDDVGMDIELLGLDKLPEKSTEAKEEREVGTLLSKEDADKVYELNYDTHSEATKGQLENPVTLLEKDDKSYIQIPIKESGAQYFRSLKFNGEEVIWNSITEAPYVIQYELENNIEDEIDVSMVIQAGPNAMTHDDIKLWFDVDSLEEIIDEGDEDGEEEEEDPTEASDERTVGTILTTEEADKVYELEYKTDSQATSNQLENPVTLLEKGNKRYVQITVNEGGAQFFRSLKFNGEEVIWNSITEAPYVIQYELENGIEDEIDISMVIQAGPNVMPHDNIKLWFDVDTLEEIIDEGEKDPVDEEDETDDPNDENQEVDDPTEEELIKEMLTPDNVSEVNYNILHEDGNQVSVADSFFEKPAFILEKDGIKYIQMTVTDGEYVKALSNEFGKALVVKENEDGSVVLQLRLNSDLSDMFLDMHIVVPADAMPGFPGYDAQHKAILSLDIDSLQELDIGDHLLVGTGDEANGNGPHVEDEPKPEPKPEPEKPEFGEGESEEETETPETSTDTDDKETNPQTGVKTNYMLYVLMLIGSMIPLAVQVRKRFI